MAPDPSLKDQNTDKPETNTKQNKSEPAKETSFLGYLREWSDALVIAFVVAMFIRMFVVELFKIPSGSMSPTLLGDFVAEGMATDQDNEAHEYLLINNPNGLIQVFEKTDDGYYDYQGKQTRAMLTASQQVLLETKLNRQEHRIIVNKFAFWFKKPQRGDIVIFRVPFELDPKPDPEKYRYSPPPPYHRDQSVYVKRAVAFGGEHLKIGDDSHLYINGKMVTDPEIMSKLEYINPGGGENYEMDVPKDHLLVFGDNSDNSLDSRYWGPLPEKNLRGKAIIRYWPFRDKWFLSPK